MGRPKSKEWNGKGGGAPHNGVTKANYRGCNSFWLSLIAMSKDYTDPRWLTMHQIMDPDKKYHPNEKWHLKKGFKATYVEYWYPYDVKNKKALMNFRNKCMALGKPTEDINDLLLMVMK